MSSRELNALQRMEYPGRIIIIGRDAIGEHDVVVYAITGRSPASQARRLVWDGHGAVRTEVTDARQLKSGDKRLLLYNCLRVSPKGLAVANGAQTNLIWQTAMKLSVKAEPPQAAEILRRAFARPALVSGIDVTSYEPDRPVFTPRISGCVAQDAALAIVRRNPDGSAQREFFQIPLEPARGALLTTYRGENRTPPPSFSGQPLEVGLSGITAAEISQAIYQALGPQDQKKDLCVGVAVVFRSRQSYKLSVSIINRTPGEG